MELGDKVVYYTHEASDQDHRTIDRLAFITGIVDEEIIDVVVFPPKGPVEFHRVALFDPDYADMIGKSYWRPEGEDSPDFAEHFAYANDPAWIAMLGQHRNQLASAPPEDRDSVLDQQRKERNALKAKLAERDSKRQAAHERRV